MPGVEKGGADIHEGRKGKNISTKGHEERRRATKGLEEAQEGSAKGRQGEKGFPRKGKKISTKGHEERRRATKGLEEAQEGSAKGGEGGKDFQEEAEVSVKGELFATFATGQVILPANVMFCLFQYRVRPGEKCGFTTKSTKVSLLQNSLGSGIYCREELLSLGARASRPHKTWQGRGDWLHRVGRFTRRLTLEQRLDKYAGGTPALPGGNPWLARCRSLSRALFCRSILPPSHARLRILQKAQVTKRIFVTLLEMPVAKISMQVEGRLPDLITQSPHALVVSHRSALFVFLCLLWPFPAKIPLPHFANASGWTG